MDNFLNYITKNLDPEEVDIWFRVNNIIPEKMELYYDLSYSLFLLIKNTYLTWKEITTSIFLHYSMRYITDKAKKQLEIQ